MSQQTDIFSGMAPLKSIKHYGKLRHRAVQLGYLARHWRAHRQYLDQLKLFQKSNVIGQNTLVDYKYLGNYLALTKNCAWRREVILSNYKAILDLEQVSGKISLFNQSTVLWTHYPAGSVESQQLITCQPTTIAPLEGEFELQFLFGNKLLATLTFVFASGSLVDVDDDAVCLIGSLQGGHDCRLETRQASKFNGEISPFTMLVLVIKSLTQAMGIEKVFGVSTSDQVALRGEHRVGLDYDTMWSREGGTVQTNGFYLLEPLASKPLNEIAQSHRKRSRHKRERKAQVVAAVKETLQSMLFKDCARLAPKERAIPIDLERRRGGVLV